MYILILGGRCYYTKPTTKCHYHTSSSQSLFIFFPPQYTFQKLHELEEKKAAKMWVYHLPICQPVCCLRSTLSSLTISPPLSSVCVAVKPTRPARLQSRNEFTFVLLILILISHKTCHVKKIIIWWSLNWPWILSFHAGRERKANWNHDIGIYFSRTVLSQASYNNQISCQAFFLSCLSNPFRTMCLKIYSLLSRE